MHWSVATAAGVATAVAVILWQRRRRPEHCKIGVLPPPPPPVHRLDLNAPMDRARPEYHTVKHGLAPVIFGDGAAGALPLWVADMELPCCPQIQRALCERAAQPHFGYTFQPSQMWLQVGRWLMEQQGWPAPLSSDEFIFSASVVAAFANALTAFTSVGDGVMVMTPLYAPLQDAVTKLGRVLVTHTLEKRGGDDVYEMGLVRLEAAFDEGGVTALVLCNPHNPSGRVWRRNELDALAKLCARRGILVLADEIWADWVLPHACNAAQFTPFRAAATPARCAHIVFGAPTKTWNLAGLHCSYAVIGDAELRARYMAVVEPGTLHYGSTFATVAMLAAYEHGAPWLAAAKAHVVANFEYLSAYLAEHRPAIVPMTPEATFLVWLDCSRLGVSPDELRRRLIAAGLLLSPGSEFGGEHCGHYQRINIACARPMLEEACRRLRAAFPLKS